MSDTTTSSTSSTKKRRTDSSKTIAIVFVALFAVSLGFNIFFLIKNNRLKDNVLSEQVKVEKLQREYKALSETKENLVTNLDTAEKHLERNKVLIRRLEEENRMLQVLKAQVAEIQKISKEFNISNKQLLEVQNKMNQTIESQRRKNDRQKQSLR